MYLRNPLETKKLPAAELSASDRHSPKTNKRKKSVAEHKTFALCGERANVWRCFLRACGVEIKRNNSGIFSNVSEKAHCYTYKECLRLVSLWLDFFAF